MLSLICLMVGKPMNVRLGVIFECLLQSIQRLHYCHENATEKMTNCWKNLELSTRKNREPITLCMRHVLKGGAMVAEETIKHLLNVSGCGFVRGRLGQMGLGLPWIAEDGYVRRWPQIWNSDLFGIVCHGGSWNKDGPCTDAVVAGNKLRRLRFSRFSGTVWRGHTRVRLAPAYKMRTPLNPSLHPSFPSDHHHPSDQTFVRRR